MSFAAATTGFATGFSLILAIGAQNAYVLRQGLRREHVLPVCLTCALSDALLITVGVAGAGTLSRAFPLFVPILTLAGAAFLIVYGALSFRRALRPNLLVASNGGNGSARNAVLTCLALAFLNPHVYLDTVGLIGAVSIRFHEIPDKVAYGLGATLASFVFFFGLGFGAKMLAPIFAKPKAWMVLDVVIGLIMWSIAVTLLLTML